MNNLFNFRLFPVLLLTLILSIIVTSLLGLGFGLVGVAIFAAIGAVLVCVYKKFNIANKVLIITLIATLATFITYSYGDSLTETYVAPNADITGSVSTDTAFDGDGKVVGNKLIIDEVVCNGAALSRKAIVYLDYNENYSINIGDRVTLVGDLESLEFKFFDSTSSGQSRNKLGYIVESVTLTGVEEGNLSLTDSVKIAIKGALYKFAPQSSEVIYSMMFEDKSNMSTFDKAVFSSIGMSHLFAVSGLHIGIIAGAVALLLRKLKLHKTLNIAITTLILILYGALCDFSPSVIRSIIMVVVFEISVLLGARNDGISSLSLAGVIILLFNPIALFDLSFVLTMLAVFGIVSFYKPLVRKMSKIPKWIANSLAMAIAVNITVFPVMLNVFGVVSFKFILATIVILPLASFAFPFMLIAIIIGLIPYLGYIIIPFNYLFIGINYISLFIAKIPMFAIEFRLDIWAIVLYIGLLTLISGYCMCKDKLKKALVGSLSVGIMALTVMDIVKVIKNPTTVTTLYVNEYSQSELIIADGKGYLIARGGINHASLKAGINLLYKNSIFEIEAIVMDEFDNYDIEVLKEVSKTTKINSICSFYLPSADLADIVSGNVVNSIIDKKISIYFNSTANEIYVNTCDVDILFLNDDDNIINANNVQYEMIFTDGTRYLPSLYADKIVVKSDLLANGKKYRYELYNGKIKEKLFN